MKKTIQINIAGLIFNIEEDAYEKLSQYLNAIKQYFASYEGSDEIVSDIEARIAEKFIAGQNPETNLVIGIEQVNSLIQSMGTVADFEAIEEEEDLKNAKISDQNAFSGNTDENKSKKLYRDTKRKALGGVLAGLAHYFSIDIVWMRIIYLFCFLVAPAIDDSFDAVSGVLFMAYLVCWIVIPPNANLDEDKHIKKLYRDEDSKVLGGVCSGLAAYFGIDVTVVRLLFAIGFFVFGIGFLTYIILWIIAPKAATITQKMEMKGEPVTLSNIENSIKENISVDKNVPENFVTKALLFPFRLLAILIKALGEILKSILPVVRVFTGLLLSIIGIALMLGIVISITAFFGVISGVEGLRFIDNAPFHQLVLEVHPLFIFFVFFAGIIPPFALLLSGLTLISNKKIGTRNFWLTILALWITGLLGTGVLVAKSALNFAKRGQYAQTKNFPMNGKILVLDVNPRDNEVEVGIKIDNEARVNLIGYEGNELKLEQTFKASGETKEKANQFAQKINYTITQKDSALLFDREISIPEKTPFRAQKLEMNLSIPYNKAFKITKEFYYTIYQSDWRNHNFEVDGEDIFQYTFMMKPDSGMVCLDCPKLTSEERNALNEDFYDDASASFDYGVFEEKAEFSKKYALKDFNKIDCGGAFVMVVKKGNTFGIEAQSDSKDALDDLELNVSDGELEIGYEDNFSFNLHNHRIYIFITMPELKSLDISGASKSKVIGFKNLSQNLAINLSGASKLALDAEVASLDFSASGASKADFIGSANKLTIDVSGACKINAQKMQVNIADIEASGASKIALGRVKQLSSNTSGASKISRE